MNIETAPDYTFWSLPQAMPTFLLSEPIDRLTEDEVPMDELEDAEWIESMIGCAYCTAPAVVHLMAGWRGEYTCELCVGEAQRHLEGYDDATPVEMDWCA